MKYFIYTILLLALIVPSKSFALTSEQNAVTWLGLASYLTENSIRLEAMNVVDCPIDIEDDSTGHIVCQIILNTFYKWKEYEFYDTEGQVHLAIKMLNPENNFLTAKEAQVLLNASKLWEQLPPANYTRQSVRGDDDREKVTSFTTITDFPWNSICYLEDTSSDNSYRGTGILISPYCVLTSRSNFTSNSEIDVIPAQYQEFQGKDIIKPYGIRHGKMDTGNSRRLSTEYEYDYGVIKLDKPFTGVSTFMPIEYDSQATSIHCAGYPRYVKDETSSYDMWYDSGDILDYEGVNDRLMIYNIDTSYGMSGAPIWKYNAETLSRRLVAIHVFDGAKGNAGCRLVSSMEPIITEWMSYYPSTYTQASYLPFFNTHAHHWTGIALANCSNSNNEVKVNYYSPRGGIIASEQKNIKAMGQVAFAISIIGEVDGWIEILSSDDISGLALIGDDSIETMYDMDIKKTLHKKFLFTHLASDRHWRSFVSICNPNNADTRIGFKYYNGDGNLKCQASGAINAHGSMQDSIYNIL